MVLTGRSGIDKTHSDPAVRLTASEWRTKARLTPSSRLARANGLIKPNFNSAILKCSLVQWVTPALPDVSTTFEGL